MFDTVVIATDGSESAERSVQTAVDFASRFDAGVHALYVVDTDEIESSPEEIRDDLETAIEKAGDEALSFAQREADGSIELTSAVREGDPATEIVAYADEIDADAIAMGTRGRHGEHAFLLGSVAEAVVRSAPQPVLTVRQLEDAEAA
ncbi:MAG: nucleotide-binding universal stress UspA family protein [Natronomonas sp.]|jgi:nucleotide-binding universal stress UspA family protein